MAVDLSCYTLGEFLPFGDLVVTTDPSITGWGAILVSCTVQGQWSEEESLLQINLLEQRAIFLDLSHWFTFFKGYLARVQTNNTTVVTYLNLGAPGALQL